MLLDAGDCVSSKPTTFSAVQLLIEPHQGDIILGGPKPGGVEGRFGERQAAGVGSNGGR